MKRKTLLYSALFFFGAASFFTPSLYADTSRAYRSNLSVEEARSKIETLLEKIDGNNFYSPEETLGYRFRFYNRWLSAYSYDIFIGTISAQNNRTVLRLEGNDGDVVTLAQIMELENIVQAGATEIDSGELRLPTEKYHLFAQTLNLVSPAVGVWYQSANSPRMTGGQAVARSIGFLAADLLALYLGGTRFFQTRFRTDINSRYIVWLLGVNRFTGALYAFNIIRGHNNLVELGYTLRFD